MPELTLADVERLEAAMLAANAANDAVAALRPHRVAKWHEHQQAITSSADACDDLAEEMRVHGPALLALAREALERRPKEQPCRDCDDTGEFYGNLNIACGCPAGAKFTPRTEESPDA